MTFAQMHESIDVILDKHDLGWFEPEEKDIFLNFAQQELVKIRYREFELDEKRRSDLMPLLKVVSGTSSNVDLSAEITGGIKNFMFAISLKGDFSITNCGSTTVESRYIRPIQHDDINKILNDPFNKPDNSNPVYTGTGKILKIISDTPTTEWTLTYLSLPKQIDGTDNPTDSPDLPEYMHEEIVNVAVRKMLGSIGSPAYQVQIGETQSQE